MVYTHDRSRHLKHLSKARPARIQCAQTIAELAPFRRTSHLRTTSDAFLTPLTAHQNDHSHPTASNESELYSFEIDHDTRSNLVTWQIDTHR
jgi:hypothetical protein